MNWKKNYYNPPFIAKMSALYALVGVAFLANRGLLVARSDDSKIMAKQTISISPTTYQFLRLTSIPKAPSKHPQLFASAHKAIDK